MNSKILIFIFCLVFASNMLGQNKRKDALKLNEPKALKFKYRALIVPTILIGYGAVGLGSNGLKHLNYDIQKKINLNGHNNLRIDDYSQYVPFLSVYGLNAVGIKGKNNFKDRTIILGTAYVIMGISVNGTKRLTATERPVGPSKTSFPSGHTATSFMGAEFIFQEYKDVSIWYGIAGYAVAAQTGFLRIYNNRHWFTDVVAGAGFGILSTKIAYWIHPWMKEKIFKNRKETYGIVMPFYNEGKMGLALTMSF